MGWGGYQGYQNMMGGAYGIGVFGLLTWILLIVFLILGIIYFWQEIRKKK